MFELLFLFIPLIAILSFLLGCLFKGSFSAWLLKRRTKSSYLDEVPIVIKDNNPQANEVVERLISTVEYIVDGNLIAEVPQVHKMPQEKKPLAFDKAPKSTTISKTKQKSTQEFAQQAKELEQNYAARPTINLTQDDFYQQMQSAGQNKETTAHVENSVNSQTVAEKSAQATKDKIKAQEATTTAQVQTLNNEAASNSDFMQSSDSSSEQDSDITKDELQNRVNTNSQNSAKSEINSKSDEVLARNENDLTSAAAASSNSKNASESPSANEHLNADSSLAVNDLDQALFSNPNDEAVRITANLQAAQDKKAQASTKETKQTTTNLRLDFALNPQNISQQDLLAARSLQDLQRPYGVIASDVGHLLELQMLGGVLCMQRGDYLRAIKIFRHIIAIPSWKQEGHKLAQINLARCYLNAGMFSRALENLLPLIGDERYESEVIELLLYIYQLNQDWQPALAVAKEIYALNKTKANLDQLCHFYLFRLLDCYLDIGHRRTMFSFQRIIALAASSVRPLVTRGNYHFALGDYHNALSDYRQAIKQNFMLLPALIANIAYCYASIKPIGEDLGTYLQSIKVPANYQYVIDLYYDLYLSKYDFLPYAHSFEFQDKAKSSAEVFRDLVLGNSPLDARDFEIELAQREKLYRKSTTAGSILENIAGLVQTEDKEQLSDAELMQQRLEHLMHLYQEHGHNVLLQRIFDLTSNLLLENNQEELKHTSENAGLVSTWFGRKKRKVEEATSDQVLSPKQQQMQLFMQKLAAMLEQDEKKALSATYVCKNCGYQQPDLFWSCPSCHKLETFTLSKLKFAKGKVSKAN
ncbi:hypothetical protein [Psittacicella hinzii]|uniref:LapB rubredoxin metal binding domain-containing protein n=1 Tax=Psittacicella hinzii TaxID=2028575 RepID=A0A3A1YTV5_9GAMM|nr:hypothetical protein [Psittacicella hinzii]RIY40618.1 hypothetical protein CKF58_00430 [Psittacicella hinzii]